MPACVVPETMNATRARWPAPVACTHLKMTKLASIKHTRPETMNQPETQPNDNAMMFRERK